MKLRSFANQVSGTFSSLSLLQILSLLFISVFVFSMFFSAFESEAGDAADTVADIAGGIGLIAGGVAIVATAPLTTSIATGVALCAGTYWAGYKLVDIFLGDDSSR